MAGSRLLLSPVKTGVVLLLLTLGLLQPPASFLVPETPRLPLPCAPARSSVSFGTPPGVQPNLKGLPHFHPRDLLFHLRDLRPPRGPPSEPSSPPMLLPGEVRHPWFSIPRVRIPPLQVPIHMLGLVNPQPHPQLEKFPYFGFFFRHADQARVCHALLPDRGSGCCHCPPSGQDLG